MFGSVYNNFTFKNFIPSVSAQRNPHYFHSIFISLFAFTTMMFVYSIPLVPLLVCLPLTHISLHRSESIINSNKNHINAKSAIDI